jgi:hypothetical protein
MISQKNKMKTYSGLSATDKAWVNGYFEGLTNDQEQKIKIFKKLKRLLKKLEEVVING